MEKFKILITDDDMDLRELLTEAVTGWGYTTSVAKNGEEALRKMRMEHYDIVISDLRMPGLGGLDLLRMIKELDKEILVIIITGYATIETAVKAIEAGAYDYIAKPFRLDELMIVIKNACERLSLTKQNKALLEELRSAYAEIALLKQETCMASAAVANGAELEVVDTSGPAALAPESDTQRPKRHNEYRKEANRFIYVNKSPQKP